MRTLLASAVAVALALPAAADDHPIVASIRPKLKEPAKPFTMFVILKVKAGQEKAFEAAFAEAAKGTKTEKGYIAYELNRLTEDGKYVAYEKWKGIDGLAEHVAAAHTQKLLKALPEFLDGDPEIKVAVAVGD